MSTGTIVVGPRGRAALVAVLATALLIGVVAIIRGGSDGEPVVSPSTVAAAPGSALDLATRAGGRSPSRVFPTPLLVADAADVTAPAEMHVYVYASDDARDRWIEVARSFGVTLPVVSGERWTIQTTPGNVASVISKVGGKVVVEPAPRPAP